jgi:isoleucyl-tRNA synthetase
LYTSHAQSPARRSAQTALYYIAHGLLRIMAPILSFTAEEAWQVLMANTPKTEQNPSIFCANFAQQDLQQQLAEYAQNPGPAIAWGELINLRAQVVKALEIARSANLLGSSLQAHVVLHLPQDLYNLCQSLGDELKFLFIVSQTTLHCAQEQYIDVQVATGEKCERCWHVREDVNQHPEYPHICGRCVNALTGQAEVREYV